MSHATENVRLSESPWIVTSRRKVHERRTCAAARRVAFPLSWLPSVQRPADHACITCLGGLLPTHDDEIDAPLTVGCSQCGSGVREECRGSGEGYHLSRYDRLADAAEQNTSPAGQGS